MVKINYGPKLLEKENIIKRISEEIKSDRIINALLLAHGFIEAYLLEILLYSGQINIKTLNKKVIENIERISFNNLLHINLVIDNISFELYQKIINFNKKRNEIVHEMISIDINDQKIKKKIEKQVKNAIDICNHLSTIYKNKIEERTKMFEK